MKVIYKGGHFVIRCKNKNGKEPCHSLNEISQLRDWQKLTDLMILYCEGKEDSTISSWINRIISTLCSTIKLYDIEILPYTSEQWNFLVKYWYVTTLADSNAKASIETRVKKWNANIKPFLEFIQFRDAIPYDVIIPEMKSVGEVVKCSSFKVQLIGEQAPVKIQNNDDLTKLIAPVSLSRSDYEYLNELKFDLERRREKICTSLTLYWQSIASHYCFGKQLLSSIDMNDIEARVEAKEYYDYVHISYEKPCPPQKHHFANPNTKAGLANYLYLIRREGLCYSDKVKNSDGFPGSSAKSLIKDRWKLFPKTNIEDKDKITVNDQLSWLNGNLTAKDCSFIIALLMMLNPKFTYGSLLSAQISNKDNKPYLELTEIGMAFTVKKPRAKSDKSETLDDLSLEIIETVIEMTADKRQYAAPENKKKLFLVANKNKTKLEALSLARISAPLTGIDVKNKKSADPVWLGTLFPSITEIDINVGTLSHAKIRQTEGVLEWLRTGSIKACSRILGNRPSTSLEHYIPRSLIALFNTRIIRKFQNLLIITSCVDEGYLFEAVDFNSLEELNDFVLDNLNDDKNKKNALIKKIMESNAFPNKQENMFGDLIASISEKALTALYLYKLASIKSHERIDKLKKKDKKSGVSPLAIISLSNYLSLLLPDHINTEMRQAHEKATKRADELIESTHWEKLFIKKESFL